MCGIAGVMTKTGNAPDPAIIDRMEAALLHRGPDGSGRYTHSDTAILQTRLAIIDLETGDQPFVLKGSRGPTALVANGEIFNYIEIREELEDARLVQRGQGARTAATGGGRHARPTPPPACCSHGVHVAVKIVRLR